MVLVLQTQTSSHYCFLDTADELHQLRGIRSEAARLQATLRQSQQAFKRRVDELEAQKRNAEFDYEKTIQRLTWERDKAEQELADQKYGLQYPA